MRFPHFDFYVRDWLNDLNNRSLTREERGVHIDLLAVMWQQQECRLPDNDRVLAGVLGCSVEEWRMWRADLIDSPFAVLVAEDGWIFSPRLRSEWDRACEKSRKAAESRSHRTRSASYPGDREEDEEGESPSSNSPATTVQRPSNERSTNVVRTSNDRGYERSTSHQSSDKDTTTTTPRPRAHEDESPPDAVPEAPPDSVFEQAADYVLPLFGRLQLKATEGPQIRRALECVGHDLARFRAIVDELAQRNPRKIRAFAYFVDRFEEEREDHAALSAPGPPDASGPPNAKGVTDHAGHPAPRRAARASRALAGSDWSVACDPLGTLGPG